MKIAMGADHRGFLHKEYIKKNMPDIEWIDVGTDNQERTDYPLFSEKVVDLILDKTVEFGVLLCASGGGMAIAANRHQYIYAVVAWNKIIARLCKQEDNANILVIPADFVSCEEVIVMINEWLMQEFKGERYKQRIDMIDKIV